MSIDNAPVQVYESDATVVQALTKAELDQQIATAKSYPRSIAAFQRRCEEMVALNPEVADECVYAVPREGKTIEGPSSRLAEIVANAWMNCRVMARILSDDGDYVVAQGLFHDLEQNVAVNVEVRRRIVDRNGRRFGVDMVNTTGNAAISIALRNAVFKGVPKAYWNRAFLKAKAIADGSPETLEKRRKAMLEYLAKQGVSEANVLKTLGLSGIDDIGLAELATLRGLATAVKEGDATLESAFGVEAPKAAGGTNGKGMAAVKSAMSNVNPVATEKDDATGGKDAGRPTDGPSLSDAERADMRHKVLDGIVGDVAATLAKLTGREVSFIEDLTDAELAGLYGAGR